MHKVIVILACLFLVACNEGGDGNDSGSPPPGIDGGQWDKSDWDGFEWQ